MHILPALLLIYCRTLFLIDGATLLLINCGASCCIKSPSQGDSKILKSWSKICSITESSSITWLKRTSIGSKSTRSKRVSIGSKATRTVATQTSNLSITLSNFSCQVPQRSYDCCWRYYG